MGIDVSLPHGGWLPRPHQLALWEYLQAGGKRAMAVWHRRAGKDEVALHHTAVKMIEQQKWEFADVFSFFNHGLHGDHGELQLREGLWGAEFFV